MKDYLVRLVIGFKSLWRYLGRKQIWQGTAARLHPPSPTTHTSWWTSLTFFQFLNTYLQLHLWKNQPLTMLASRFFCCCLPQQHGERSKTLCHPMPLHSSSDSRKSWYNDCVDTPSRRRAPDGEQAYGVNLGGFRNIDTILNFEMRRVWSEKACIGEEWRGGWSQEACEGEKWRGQWGLRHAEGRNQELGRRTRRSK